MKSILLAGLFLCLFIAPGLRAEDGEEDTVLSRAQAFDTMINTAGSLLTGLKARELEVAEFGEFLFSSTENLYAQGFITIEQYNTKNSEISTCIEDEKNVRNPPPMNESQYSQYESGMRTFYYHQYLRNRRDQSCAKAVDFNTLKNSQPSCIQVNKVQAGGQCCNGLVPGVSASLEKVATGKKMNEACSSHNECASKMCQKDDGATSGICGAYIACLPVNALGAECSPENPNCASGVCRMQIQGTPAIECKVNAAACTSDNECCSTKCSGGKCVDKYLCEQCIPEGKKPKGNEQCCRGFIQDMEDKCSREMPPFILPSSSSIKRGFWHNLAIAVSFISIAHAAEITTPTSPTAPTNTTTEVSSGSSSGDQSGNTSQGTWVNDDALTPQQLELIETEIKEILKIKDKSVRKTRLLAVYEKRKQMTATNAAAIKAGQKIGKTLTQEEYVKNYNIPAITPKDRSNVERCEFNTAKDNWIDSSNLMRNAELFLRAFEVSYSGKGTQDLWHLLDKNGRPHKDNLYTRTKAIMSQIRDNRNMQRDQLKYLDLLMACQCIYTFGPEKFDGEKQAFFYSQCTGRPDNKICRDGEMRNNLKLAGSAEAPFRDGQEFPNYVEMYLQKLEKMAGQATAGKDDVDNIDSGAAGINHEEVLVRWLRMRSCNQVDVFMDAEKVETDLTEIAEDIYRARKDNPQLEKYWKDRLEKMANGGVNSNVIKIFADDTNKTTWYRGYIHTESKVHSWTKKTLKFLVFIVLALLALATFGIAALAGAAWATLSMAATIAGAILGVGAIFSSGGGGAGSYSVIESFAKDFPNVIIEDRLVEKRSCGKFKLWRCKTFYRILHWPAFSNNPGLQNSFPWTKREEKSCDQTYQLSVGYPGVTANPCSGPFKATMCARSFMRPMPDVAITNKKDFAPWKELMKDKMIMDPVLPEFYSKDVNLNNGWVPALQQGFLTGCQWVKNIGKAKAKVEDKLKFFPDFKKYVGSNGDFLPEYQFSQVRIDDYKNAVKKYALCDRLSACGQQNYDGQHPNPIGFGDIFETTESADLFANYVYQIHFKWRHMSSNSGVGYPLSFLENYYMSLVHNVRLLTTLSVRRGLELDDAFNKYAEDLAIRRSRYQLNGNSYGLEMGNDGRDKGNNTTSNLFRGFRSLGFPLSAEFQGLPSGSALTATSGSGASGTALNNFEQNALAAARRTAERVAKDNAKWKNYQERTKGDKNAAARLASAQNFFSGMNAPLAAVPSMAKPGDNSSYSGIGGKMGTLNGAGSNLANKEGNGDGQEQTYGAVENKNASSGAGGAGSSSGLGGSDMGLGDGGLGAYDSGNMNLGAGSGDGPTDGSGNSLSDAMKTTGMKEGELRNMLESAQKNRNNLQSGEDDTLFQKVSKAYFRNLDRVLVRKKGEAAPKKTNQEAVDPEKEAVKKIFAQ